MKSKKKKESKKSEQDVNSKRKRISIDADGKPVKNKKTQDDSSDNFKPSPLKEDS